MGRSRGGLGTKIHLATDGSRLPLNIVLSLGQARESQFALRLLYEIGIQRLHSFPQSGDGHNCRFISTKIAQQIKDFGCLAPGLVKVCSYGLRLTFLNYCFNCFLFYVQKWHINSMVSWENLTIWSRFFGRCGATGLSLHSTLAGEPL